jgi:HlyD family secretion protein
MKRISLVLMLAGMVGMAGRAYYVRENTAELEVTTAPITRGNVVDAVAASGTLQAVTTVQVGSQVSGNISWLGADFNSIVKKGQVIARLDPSLMEAQVEQARANVVKAEADLERSRVALEDAQQKLARANQLDGEQLLPKSDVDEAKVAADSARAQVQSSQAQVVQARAALNQSRVNVAHTVIEAPIDGIVIERQVDVGQTVAASLQSPTIFAIAADLTKMEVNATIDESDIGRIHAGQAVTFTVDAYPNEPFAGRVEQVRLQPTVVQNVTTYSTIISAPNSDLKLKPGMTANVKVQIARRDAVTRVPNAALRFKPSPETLAAFDQSADMAGRGPHIWINVNDTLKPVTVRTGITDGAQTELIGDSLQPGTEVVTAITAQTGGGGPTIQRSPLMGNARRF